MKRECLKPLHNGLLLPQLGWHCLSWTSIWILIVAVQVDHTVKGDHIGKEDHFCVLPVNHSDSELIFAF